MTSHLRNVPEKEKYFCVLIFLVKGLPLENFSGLLGTRNLEIAKIYVSCFSIWDTKEAFEEPSFVQLTSFTGMIIMLT